MTQGQESSHGNGYRDDLKMLLESQGQTVNMVGSHWSGEMRDNRHEGWSGWVIDDIAGKAKNSLPVYKPNVVTLLAGTNDAKAHTTKSDQEYGIVMRDRLNNMIKTIFEHVPDVLLVVSKLPPCADPKAPWAQGHVTAYNSHIPDLVKAWADGEKSNGQKKHIAMIDAGKVLQVSDLVDGTHPGDKGYARLGNEWYKAIVEHKEWIKEPVDIPAKDKGIW